MQTTVQLQLKQAGILWLWHLVAILQNGLSIPPSWDTFTPHWCSICMYVLKTYNIVIDSK